MYILYYIIHNLFTCLNGQHISVSLNGISTPPSRTIKVPVVGAFVFDLIRVTNLFRLFWKRDIGTFKV